VAPGESKECVLLVLGSVRRRYSVGTGDDAGTDVEDILVMVGRPPGRRNWGC
jgi:hypothetical protein